MEILNAIAGIFQPDALLFMVVGVLVGALIGAMPGLSVTMAIAILTPLTFWLEPTQGLAMLIGVYNAGVWAGGISAVLLNTPGTPASIMSTLDGYRMTQRGEAGLALGINTVFSVMGGIFSTIILMFAAFPIAEFALNFGPAEFTMIAVFGLTMIISISGGSLVKGLLAGFMGLLFSTMGMDTIVGYPRYTFGVMELMNGLPFVAVMIGLFGLGEVFVQISEKHRTAAAESFKGKIGRILPTWAQMKRFAPASLLSAVVGTLVGAVPGAGGDIASIVCWDQAKKISKEKDQYGKGSAEGLAVTCLANNAVIGGAMTTMMALGVPGDAATAVLIGSLMMYGVTPGPVMFIEKLDLVYTIMGLMILANLLILVVGLVSAKASAKLLNRLSSETIWISVLLLCFIGAYAINNSVVDVWIMLACGVLGFVFRKLGVPLAPFVLAIILGPMAETNLRRTLTMTGGSYSIFFTNPLSLVLLLLSVGSLVGAAYRQFKKAKPAAESTGK